ncbi:MAG TPA: CPBP family intramembrane glutamic endopeptidase [Thermoanaerobaculaceae bacterium]|nr:CPBP family intramembrane glutamic endopeptidase [Thermoanaerobaculaceae bacterium]
MAFSLWFASLAAVTFLLAKPFDRRIAATFALLCAAYLGADDLVTGLPSLARGLDVLGGHWNWSGKVLSLALSAIVIAALRLSPAAVGLTFRQRHVKAGLIALVAFIAWGAGLGLLFRPGVPTAETLAFQATMPGLAEELVYRGIAPALLLGLMRKKAPVEGTPWAVILATSVAFGAWHGLNLSHGRLGFDVMSALFPFLGSIPGGWLRFETRSLVFPVLAHGLANLAFQIAGGLVA